MAHHELMGGRLHVYKRDNGKFWQCSTFLGGHNRRVSTKLEGIAQAKDFAEDWYLELKGKHKRGEMRDGKTFREAATQFVREFKVMTEGQRNAHYVNQQSRRLENYLLPFFGEKLLTEITPQLVQDYRIDRHLKTTEKRGKPPARQTIHQEIVTLRHVLKTANRNGWIPFVPDISEPYRMSRKVSHRAWFSPEEYKKLYTAAFAGSLAPQPRTCVGSSGCHASVRRLSGHGEGCMKHSAKQNQKTMKKTQNTTKHNQQPTTGKPATDNRQQIDLKRRHTNRVLDTENILALMERETPEFFERSEVVGKWVWIQFDGKQPAEVTRVLAELGFHWNYTRQVWQHPAGTIVEDRATYDPRKRYGSYFPATQKAA